MKRLFVAMIAWSLAATCAAAQVGGTTSRVPGKREQARLITAAKAAFGSQLSRALSAQSIQAMQALASQLLSTGEASFTNFDDVSAPCDFVDTVPLRGLHQSDIFFAPRFGGGSILNDCSNFGVSPHSPPNFLAFNIGVINPGGGCACLPELITVGAGKSSVSLWIAGGNTDGYPIGVIAIGDGGVKGVQTITTTKDFQQVTLTGSGISFLAIVGSPAYLLIDDISAQ